MPDLAKGQAKEPGFRAKSRFARVPVLELEDGRTIVESGAVMLYLAQGRPSCPTIPICAPRRLYFEQADLLRALALPRFYHLRGIADQMARQIADFQEGAYSALQKLDEWLIGRVWFVDERYTIADIGLYGYVSMAPEGGYDMLRFQSICACLARVEARPDWVPLVEEI